MTSGTGTSGNEPVTAEGIHDQDIDGSSAPRTQQQMRATGEAMVDILLAQVFYAFAGVSIFGVNPFGFMRQWADDLVARANDAYTNAAYAQTSANVANTEIAIIKADLAADGIGGAALSDRFDGAAAGSLNPTNWSQTYYSVGAGYLGLDGNGNAQWFASGGGPRGSINCFQTALDGDNQAAAILLGSVPDSTTATWPEIHILLRMDDAGNAVAAKIVNGAVQIGYLASNSFVALGSPVSVTMVGQQSYQFKATTDITDTTHTFKILQDNVEVASLTSPTSGATLYGPGYRQPGWISYAGTTQNTPFTFIQVAPPVVRVFSAGDIPA